MLGLCQGKGGYKTIMYCPLAAFSSLSYSDTEQNVLTERLFCLHQPTTFILNYLFCNLFLVPMVLDVLPYSVLVVATGVLFSVLLVIQGRT